MRNGGQGWCARLNVLIVAPGRRFTLGRDALRVGQTGHLGLYNVLLIS